MVNIAATYGALLIGSLVSVCLSGIVAVQCSVYFKLYPSDLLRTKALVTFIWILDSSHTIFVCASAWDYLITHFGDSSRIDFIPRTVALTIAFTAILTFFVHCFFAHRIYKLSKNRVCITALVVLLAILRLGAATVTTAEMIRLQRFSLFVREYRWVFTLGLALSSAADILIAVCLCYFLRTSRTGHADMDHVLDVLMLYAFENGSLTCAATIVSMLCWLTMPHNLIFMGLHFVISKLYSNSLLATLNTRKNLKRGASISVTGDRGVPVLFPDSTSRRQRDLRDRYSYRIGETSQKNTKLEISVVQTIQCDADEPLSAVSVHNIDLERSTEVDKASRSPSPLKSEV